jgi:hypothetical protein
VNSYRVHVNSYGVYMNSYEVCVNLYVLYVNLYGVYASIGEFQGSHVSAQRQRTAASQYDLPSVYTAKT